MNQRSSYIVFLFILAVILLLTLGPHLAPDHSLYLVQIEDPVPRFSFYPWLVHSARSFRDGFFPLWNHLSGTGFPHLANYQSSPLNPLKWAYYLYPSLRVLDTTALLRLALMGIFTFMFLRRLKLAPLAAGVGAIAFTFSGYMMKHVNQININTEMWIPLMLFLLHGQLRDRPSLRRFLLSGLVSCMAFLGGNPEAAFYFVLINVLYSLFIMRFSLERLAGDALCIFGPFLLGVLLASAQLMPFLEYLGPGWHIHTNELHLVAPHSPRYFFSLILPWLCGQYFGLNKLILPYIGMLTALFAFLAFLHPKSGARPLFFFLTYIIVFLGLIYKIPPLGWINYLPIFSNMGNVKFAMAGISFCFACACGMGIDIVIRKKVERKKLSVALGAIVLLSFISIGLAMADHGLPAHFHFYYLWPLIFLAAAGFLLITCKGKQKFLSVLYGSLGFLIVLELITLRWGLYIEDFIDTSVWRFENPVQPSYLEPLDKHPVPDRFLARGVGIHHSLNILYGVNDLRAFEGMYPRDYVAAMGRIEGFSMEESVDAFFSHGWSFDVSYDNMSHELIDILGIKYAFLYRPPHGDNWLLRQDDKIDTYENTEAFPRAFMVRDLSEHLAPVKEGQIQVSLYKAEKVELKVDYPDSGYLVLTDTYFPGWQARLDGKPVRIEKAAELVRAVPVPAGKHLIEMRYEPWGFRIGLWSTLVSLLLIIILLVSRARAYSKVMTVE